MYFVHIVISWLDYSITLKKQGLSNFKLVALTQNATVNESKLFIVSFGSVMVSISSLSVNFIAFSMY